MILRAFSFARPKKGSGVEGIYPRHAQMAGDLGFDMQFNVETHFAQLCYPWVELSAE